MEIRLILRYYRTLLFCFKKSNFNKKQYLIESEKFLKSLENSDVDNILEIANNLKKTYILYCEELLHIISTYHIILKLAMPVLLIVTTILFLKYKIILLFLASFSIFMIAVVKYLDNKWKLVSKDYTTEITSINMLLNNKLNLNIDTDFDYLGEQYQFGELND